jgi:ABC-type multidrug transport system fused ATPase/permease subunit
MSATAPPPSAPAPPPPLTTDDEREAITYYQQQEEGEPAQAPLQWSLVRRIFRYTLPYRARRNWLFVLTLLRGAQLPAMAWMIGQTINGPIAGRDWRGIQWHAAGYLAMTLFMVVTLHFRQLLALELGEAVVHDMRRDLFEKLATLPMSYFDQTKFGRIISRMTSDIDSIRVGVQDVAFVFAVQGMQMGVSAALMAWYDWKLFAIMLLLAPAIWILNAHYRRVMASRLRKLQQSWSRLASTLAESVGGIRVTQAFVRHEVNAGFFRKLVNVHGDNNVGVARASAVFVPLLQMKSQLFLGVMALLGGYGALLWHGWAHVEVGDLVMFFFLANLFFEPVQVLGDRYNQALNAMAGGERLFRLLDRVPAWRDAPSARPLPPVRGRVEFQSVFFEYHPGRPVLTDISFLAEPGQTIALVGHTGSGKTTLVALLQKLHLPGRGNILIDGHNILDVTGDSLHAQMGSVQQNNFLFSGSVLDNIRFARPEATEADVRRTLQTLDCLDMIEGLSDGVHHQVGQQSAALSLGQRQLVCFARAMLANPRIVVLDEATSAIDTMTETRLQRALEILLRGRTAFVVAHRLSTIRKADLVLVMDRGRIVERGTHHSLLRDGGVYARLHREFIGANE